MDRELKSMMNQLTNASEKADAELTENQINSIAKELIANDWRLTEEFGPYIAERGADAGRTADDIQEAIAFAGTRGRVLRRRRILRSLETVDLENV